MANYDTMRSYLDLIVAGDFETALGYFTDDITVHFGGGRTTHGKAAYMESVGNMMGSVDSMQVEEHDLLVSDNHAVVLNAWHIKKGDRDEHANHVIVYHTEGDKISEIWIVAEDQSQMEGLMG